MAVNDNDGSQNCWDSGGDEDLRRRREKLLLGLLLTSNGVPLLQEGDEFGRTKLAAGQDGARNSWDWESVSGDAGVNSINWIDWGLKDGNAAGSTNAPGYGRELSDWTEGLRGGDDALDEIDEVGQRFVLIGEMPFHRQVRRVDLQQIAVRDDCLVFHLQCASERIEIGILGVVPGIAHRGGDDAGRGRRHERFDKTAACRIQRAAEILALGFHHRAIQIAYLTHRLGHTTGVADRLVDRVMRRLPSAEGWVVRDIGERPARPAAADPLMRWRT